MRPFTINGKSMTYMYDPFFTSNTENPILMLTLSFLHAIIYDSNRN